jgi:hypothetical protein
MSEIKGQILGIVLVLAIFGTVAGLLVAAFKSSATSVASKIESADTVAQAKINLNQSYFELITF